MQASQPPSWRVFLPRERLLLATGGMRRGVPSRGVWRSGLRSLRAFASPQHPRYQPVPGRLLSGRRPETALGGPPERRQSGPASLPSAFTVV